jgi:hypothetical protein
MSRAPLTFAVVAAVFAAVLGVAHGAFAEEIRDPTRPPMRDARAADAVRESAPVLSAVMSFNGRRIAIFNGHVVSGGSVVGAYTIDSVLEDGVRYRYENATHELHLAHPATTFKKPATGPARSPSGVQQ